MAFVSTSQLPLIRELIAACGITSPVAHLVVDIPVDGTVRVYAVLYPNPDFLPPLVKAVQAVSVSERGEITAAPLSLTDTSRMLANAVLAGEVEAARALADEIIEHCVGK